MNIEYMKEFTKKGHGNQKRMPQCTPYYLHPFGVCEILKEKGYDDEYQIVGLFHDLLEDTEVTYEEIVEISNQKIAEAVKLVTKENNYNIDDYFKRIKNNEIARVVKIADRIHNLSEFPGVSGDWLSDYIVETEKYFIDLASGTDLEEDLLKVIEECKEYISITRF